VEIRGDSTAVPVEGTRSAAGDTGESGEGPGAWVREGTDFHYLVGGLGEEPFDLELRFAEPAPLSPGQVVFDVLVNGELRPLLTSLDPASFAGPFHEHRVILEDVTAPGGVLDLEFRAEKGKAPAARVLLLREGKAILDIDPRESRHWTRLPPRFTPEGGNGVYEVVLGRLGSRFMLNPLPRLLAWRQSPLGTWTGDISELVLAFRDAEGDVRCFPFTDRYPVFSFLDQETRLTGVTFTARDPSLPFEAEVSLTAPFYPGHARLSTAPFFYLTVHVANAEAAPVEGKFLFVRPHKEEPCGDEAPRSLGGGLSGYRFVTRCSYGEESTAEAEESDRLWRFEEAVAVDDPSGVEWRFDHPRDTEWIWPSPQGYPPPYPVPVYTFIPRGFSGFEWSFRLAAGEELERTVVLACHTSQPVLARNGKRDLRFLYTTPRGGNFSSAREVVSYALGAERPSIEEKSLFMDNLLSPDNLSPFPDEGRNLAAVALQNFLVNTWWCASPSGEEWYSTWEGEAFLYHSSLDVEYNNAWFYLCFWPELLEKLLRRWPALEKENDLGRYLPHDLGIESRVGETAFPYDMPVEANTDYLLLLYAYWRSGGDTALVEELLPRALDYALFVIASDTDGDGLPDAYTSNTFDQASAEVQRSRNQAYLGVKAAAALDAVAQMSEAFGLSDPRFSMLVDGKLSRINRTLREVLWTGDHFALCNDPSVAPAFRTAYSIHVPNGLLYPHATGGEGGLDPVNLDLMRRDILASLRRTRRNYGCVHSSPGNENQWVSQNLWRDSLGYRIAGPGWFEEEDSLLRAYWELELYYATRKSGGFWDACFYNPGAGPREEMVIGAFPPDHALDQSLGYYSRGAAFFAVPESLAGLGLDRPSDLLYFRAPPGPAAVPVLRCADWSAEEPGRRVPVLHFDEEGRLVRVVNRHLLPSRFLSGGRESGSP
jgi:hypothetical protein